MISSTGTVYIGTQSLAGRLKTTAKLNTLAKETEAVIYDIASVFPFQLFPDKLIIDKNKVSIIRKSLFFKRIFPILYEDIRTVKINRSILFCAIEFEIRGYEQNPGAVTHLWPKEASKAEKYILGMTKANRAEVDMTKLPVNKIRGVIKKIGETQEDVERLF